MCEAVVYIEREGSMVKLWEDVIEVKPEGGKLVLVDVFGDQMIVSAAIREVHLMEHEVFLVEKEAAQ